MSKVIKEYNLPDDKEELEIDQAAHRMYSALIGIKRNIRDIVKYGNTTDDIEKIYEMICNNIAETGLEM